MNRRGTSEVLGEAIAGARQGDRDAVHFLYIRYADLVYGCISQLLGDPEQAEALTQDVFCGLTDSLGGYQSSGLPFTAWLERLAREAARRVEPRPRRMVLLSR